MSITVKIPTPLQKLTQNQAEVQVNASNLKELIDDLDKKFPGIKGRLYDDQGKLHRFINFYVNEEDVRFLQQEETPLKDGDEVSIIPAIAGGSALNKQIRLEDLKAYQGFKKLATHKGAMICLTYQCQFQCEHCGVASYQRKDRKELTTSEIKNAVLDRLKACGIEVAYFFGGEPTLHKDIIELIRYTTEKGLYSRFDTNGLKLAEMSFVKSLKSAGITYILVSVDSSIPEVHDKFRRFKGAWTKAIEGIKNCVKEGIPVGISTVVTPDNLKSGDFKKVIQLAKDLGVFKIRSLLPIMCGRWIKQGIELTKDEKKEFISLLEPNFVFWEDFCDGTVSFGCAALVRWLIYVSVYGDVQPCCYIPIRFGNVRKDDLKTILEEMWKTSFFDIKREAVNREDCPMNMESIRSKILKLAERQGGFPVDYDEEVFRR